MRDFLVTLLVLASVPMTLVRPHVGVLVGTWLSLMSPHRLTWGYAQTLRVAMIVAAATLVAWIISREPKRPPGGAVVALLGAFTFWIFVCMPFALVPDEAWDKFVQVIKILILTYVAMCLIQGKERIQALVWVTALSIAFYGLRGGVFTILTAGQYRVWGPPGTFIEDNNQLGLAMVMVLPLLYYLQLSGVQSLTPVLRRWVRLGLWGLMGLTVLAILGTYSRGAFLGLSIVMAFLWWRTPHRIVTGTIFAVVLAGALLSAPEKWFERMESIASYHEDESVQGRFDAWTFATRLALDRPIVGGGFRVFYDKDIFLSYIPDAPTSRNAHSIYFEVLGEMGFVGLFLFLALGLAALLTAQRIIRLSRDRPELLWAERLGRMMQVSLIGYASAGAFLNLGFFDLYYTLLVILVATRAEVLRVLAESKAGAEPRTSLRPFVAGQTQPARLA
jgi:probable O-glycosylation ligase (exosortase A-associated)